MGIWLLENDILRTNYCCIWCREISLKTQQNPNVKNSFE